MSNVFIAKNAFAFKRKKSGRGKRNSMIGESRQPRIVSIGRQQKSLLDYRESGDYVPYRRQTPAFYAEAKQMFTDNEIILLAIWLVVSPSAALAYLIWIKYEHLRLLALLLFAIGIIHAFYQWQGFYSFVRNLAGI